MRYGTHITPQERAIRTAAVKKYYPTMFAREVDRMFGWPNGTASRMAHDLGIKHNADVEARIKNREWLKACCNTPESIAKANASKRHLRKIEEMRLLMGEPQWTRIKIAQLSARTQKAKWHLIHHYGYIPDPTKPLVLYYDENTRRMLYKWKYDTAEQYYTENFRFTFAPLPVDEPEEEPETE